MSVFNITVSYILIYGVGPFSRMETKGAALATGLSFVVGALITFPRLFQRSDNFHVNFRHLLQFHKSHLTQICKIAIPNLSELVALRLGHWGFFWIVSSLGTVTLAAHYIAVRVESIAYIPAYGFSAVAPILVGHSLGSGRIGLVEKVLKRLSIIGCVSMILISFTFLVSPGTFILLFSPNQKVYDLAYICVQIAAIELPFCCLSMVYSNGMRGAGDTIRPLYIAITGSVLFRVGIVYYFAVILELGLVGVWYGTALEWMARAISSYILFKTGIWKRIEI